MKQRKRPRPSKSSKAGKGNASNIFGHGIEAGIARYSTGSKYRSVFKQGVNGMTKNWMSTAIATGLAAFVGSAAEAREHASAFAEIGRAPTQTAQTSGRTARSSSPATVRPTRVRIRRPIQVPTRPQTVPRTRAPTRPRTALRTRVRTVRPIRARTGPTAITVQASYGTRGADAAKELKGKKEAGTEASVPAFMSGGSFSGPRAPSCDTSPRRPWCSGGSPRARQPPHGSRHGFLP